MLPVLPPPPRLLLAHYMPWFENKAVSQQWGWHWTMGKVDPDKGQIASKYHPLIGLYDSNDPQVVDCHVLLMKYSGIDGVLVDWYGNLDRYDYATNHRNTQRMFNTIRRAGMKFGVVYEDQTVPNLISGGNFRAEQAVAEGHKLLQWVAQNWFTSPNYVTIKGKPAFLVFGPQYYKTPDWVEIFRDIKPAPAFITLHHRREPAIGGYDWPLPKDGRAGADRERAAFLNRAKDWDTYFAAAYPRFDDYYKEAGLHDSWGKIDDLNGQTYVDTLTEALKGSAPIIQIATWNDWGEGTSIEPSIEFGYRDLEQTQSLRSKYLGKLPYSPADLRLPVELYKLQKQYPGNPAIQQKLQSASNFLFQGNPKRAKAILKNLTPISRRNQQ